MIQLYLKNIDDIEIEEINKYTISVSRKNKIASYTKVEDKKRSLAAALALTHALKEYGYKGTYQYQYTKLQKPYLMDGPFFNISHSGKYAIASVYQNEIGVDIEKIETPLEKIIIKFMNDIEIKMYEIADTLEKQHLFYQIWTIKESYVKLLGIGLTKQLTNIEIDYTQNSVELKGYLKTRFAFLNVNGYAISICYVAEKEEQIRLEYLDEKKVGK